MNNKGFGVIEVILLLVIIIGLVIIFKSEIEEIVKTAFEAVTDGTDTLIDG